MVMFVLTTHKKSPEHKRIYVNINATKINTVEKKTKNCVKEIFKCIAPGLTGLTLS